MDVMSARRAIIAGQDQFIPPEYQRCNWIQSSSNNQRVIILPNTETDDQTLKFDFDMTMDTRVSYGMPFSNYQNEDTRCWRLCLFSGTDTRLYGAYCGMGNRRAGSSPTIILTSTSDDYLGQRINYLFEWGKLTINNSNGFSNVITAQDSDTPMANAHLMWGGGAMQKRLWFMKVYRGDYLIHNYLPVVRKSDNKAGLYDTVKCTFSPSEFSQDFVSG